MPKVSFVVPVYNKSAYLAETIESLIKQTLKSEIVVVDDGSTDDIDFLKDHYGDKVSWYTLPENKGRSYARNFGNEKAKSNIVAVLDADDTSLPQRAKEIVKFFETGIDVFYSSYYTVNYYGQIGCRVKAEAFDYERILKTGMTMIGHSTMAYRKKAVLDVKYNEGEYSELGLDDWKIQIDLYRKGYKFGHSTKFLSKYKLLSDSISVVRDATKVHQLKYKFLEEIQNEKVKSLVSCE